MAKLLKLISLCVITREPVVPTKTFNYTQNLRFPKPATEAMAPALSCQSYPGKWYPPYASTTAGNPRHRSPHSPHPPTHQTTSSAHAQQLGTVSGLCYSLT